MERYVCPKNDTREKKLWIASFFCLCLFASCGGDDNKVPDWNWGEEEEEGGTDKPEAKEKPRYVWMMLAGISSAMPTA
ncbi:MAG: hypothetical protein ACLUVZ_15960 [Bacteroides stercoris]